MTNRNVWLILIANLCAGTSWATNDPFVGQWRLNPLRSQLTDEMRVTQLAQEKYAFDFGGGQPETIVIDGTDQPGFADTTLSVAVVGPTWKVIRKKDGHTVLTATWALSKDGQSLIDDFTSFAQDGSASNVKYVYKRAPAGGSGFAGNWVSISEDVISPFTLQISVYDGDGLSFAGASGTTNVKFDGKSARRLNANAMERIESYKDKVIQTRQYRLSPDLRTLTITTHTVGHTAPNIFVFDRQ